MSSDLRRLRYARGHRTRNKTGRGRQVIHKCFFGELRQQQQQQQQLNNNDLTKIRDVVVKTHVAADVGHFNFPFFQAVLRHMIKNTMQLKTATASRLPAEFVQGAFLAAAN